MPNAASPSRPYPRVLRVGKETPSCLVVAEWVTNAGGIVTSCKGLSEACRRQLNEYEAVLVADSVRWSALEASLDKLRSRLGEVPLLVLTDVPSASGASTALVSLGEDFVVVPAEPAELVGRLGRLLARTRRPGATLRFEDIEVDVEDRECRVGGEVLSLTPKELGVLEIVLSRAPHTVPRDELLETLWNGDVERGRGALDVHTTHLRQKLAGAHSRASVATVRGTGFRMANVRVELPTHLVLEAAPDGMLVADSDGEILMVNAQLVSMFGTERGDLIGATVESLIPKRFAEGHKRHRERFEGSSAPRRMGTGVELYGLRDDGTEFPVDVSLSPIQTREGAYVVAAVRARLDTPPSGNA